MERAGIVLCGGRSRRMGRPKALLPWFGRRMVDHVVDRLAACVDEIVVVTSEGLAFDPLTTRGVRVVVDSEPERGPLAALRDGLAAIRAELAFVTSTDAPFLTAAHVDALLREALNGGDGRHGGRDGAPRAVVPRADGFLQVLSAVYPREAGREAEALLAAGIASPAELAQRIGARILDVASRTATGADELAPWTGFNTPAEYLELALRVDPSARARVEWKIERRAEGGAEEGGEDGEESPASTTREVPIGRLGDVLRATAPRSDDVDAARAEGRLRVVLEEGELARDFDDALPIGPGERVVVHERLRGAGPARSVSR